MATRSTIILKTNDNKYKYSYCHWDGYLSNNGRILFENYNTYEKVEELLSFGSISVLGKSIHPDPSKPHDFENKQDDVCVFYHRDRQEDLCLCETLDFGDIFKCMEDYVYLFVDEKWKYLRCEDFYEILKELEILKEVGVLHNKDTNSKKYERWESLTGDDKLDILKEVNVLKELEPEDFVE